MFPQIIHRILPSGAYSPALGQIERHLLWGVKTVQDHEHDPVARVARPVLSRMGGVVDVVVVDTPSKRRDTFADHRILVDLDDVSVSQDLERLLSSIAEVSANKQRRLKKCPRSEMALRLIIRQVSWRITLASISYFEQVQIVVAEEVGCFRMKGGRVDDCSQLGPPRLDVAGVAPRLGYPATPDPGLVPSPLAEGVLESDIGASGELGDGVGHSCEAADHAVLGDVVGWYVWLRCQQDNHEAFASL